jgi:ferric-dicitrate binding protein FerR (iron transport regulator)
MDKESLLSRYLSGELGPEEEKDFLELLERDSSLKAELEEYRKIWDSVGSVSEDVSYDMNAEWSRLQPRLAGFAEAPETRAPGKVRSLLYYTYRIAAVLVLGLVLSLSWFYVNRIAGMEKVVARDEAIEVMLEDGTQLLVNRNSTIRYSKNFLSAERRVFLSGEAWFDVARDTTRPFVIEAGNALVEVLGTSFNVNAYRESPVVEITVESGLVALSAKENQDDLIVMKAGSGGTYHKTQKELTLVASSNPNNISWKTRELYFDGSSLGEVLSLLRKVYGANLVIENPELESCPITVTFKDQSLDAVLKVLEMTLDLEITRSGDEIRLNGKGCKE